MKITTKSIVLEKENKIDKSLINLMPKMGGLMNSPTFAFQSTTTKRTSFFGVSPKGLISLHRTTQLQLCQH